MSEVSGVVEAVSKTNKGVKINGKWHNSGQPMFEGVRRGQVLTFEAETSDNGSSFVKRGSSIDVQSGPSSGGSGSKSKGNSYEVGAATGMAVNNAILLAISLGKGLDEEFIKKTAREVYSISEDLKTEFANAGLPQEKVPASVPSDSGTDPFIS